VAKQEEFNMELQNLERRVDTFGQYTDLSQVVPVFEKVPTSFF